MSAPDGASIGHGVESSLEDLYEHAPCGYLSTTLDGTIVRVNETFVRWSGYRRDQLLGTQFLSLLSPGGQLFYESRYVPVLHLQGEAREVALDLRHASGTVLPMLVNGAVVNDDEGRPAAIRTAVFEYGGRKEYERELLAARRLAEASESRLQLVHDATKNFIAAESDEDLAEELANGARTAFAAPDVSVYLLDGSGQLTRAAGTALLEASLLRDGGPMESAVSDRKVVTLDDADASPEAAEAMRSERVETAVIVPLNDHQKRLGAFVMFFRRARALEPHDTELAETFARQAAEVLGRLQAERVLERLALYDELTGLPTRRLIRARVNEAIDQAHVSKGAAAVIMIDVNGLRAIDDTFGHVARDEALVEIGARLSAEVRDGDLVGRFGDDEFVVVCPGADSDTVEAMAERLIATLRQPLQVAAGHAAVASSIGAAVYSGASGARPSWQALFEGAGQAMYRSKSTGEHQAVVVAVGGSAGS